MASRLLLMMYVCSITVIHWGSCCVLKNRVIHPGDVLIDTSDRLPMVLTPLMPK